MAGDYRYNKDRLLVTHMEFEFANYMAGERDEAYWADPEWSILADVEEAATDGCGEDGRPWPEELCRRWGERFGIGPDMDPEERRRLEEYLGLGDRQPEDK